MGGVRACVCVCVCVCLYACVCVCLCLSLCALSSCVRTRFACCLVCEESYETKSRKQIAPLRGNCSESNMCIVVRTKARPFQAQNVAEISQSHSATLCITKASAPAIGGIP